MSKNQTKTRRPVRRAAEPTPYSEAVARAVSVGGYVGADDTTDGLPTVDKMVEAAKSASRYAAKIMSSQAPEAVKSAANARAARAQSALAKSLATEATRLASALQSATDRWADNPTDPMLAAEVQMRTQMVQMGGHAPEGVDLVDYFLVVGLSERNFATMLRYS